MRLARFTRGAASTTVPYKKEPVSDYNQNTSWVPQSSLLDSIGKRGGKALGIKEYAWKGIPTEMDS